MDSAGGARSVDAVAPAAVVLAAGQGTRMRSRLPKVLHEVAGRPMVRHVVRAARGAGAARVVVVVGHGADLVRDALAGEDVAFAVQREQLGTGHALGTAVADLRDHDGPVFALNGDGPLITADSLRAMTELQAGRPGMTMMTVRVDDPTGLGRVVRDEAGGVRAIVEERDADDRVRAIREVSPGVFLFDRSVWSRIEGLSADNAQGEIYITDLPASYLADGLPVRGYEAPDAREGMAANDRVQLAGLERVFRERINEGLMRTGVTMLSPETTFVDDDVVVEPDVVLEPFVVLRGGTRIGPAARVGAASHLTGCTVDADAVVPPHTVAVDRRFG